MKRKTIVWWLEVVIYTFAIVGVATVVLASLFTIQYLMIRFTQ